MDAQKIAESSCQSCQGLGVVTDGFCVSRCPACQTTEPVGVGRREPIRDDRPWPRPSEECGMLLASDEQWLCVRCSGVEACHGCGALVGPDYDLCDQCNDRIATEVHAEMDAERRRKHGFDA
jgi:hypothetical protein